MYDVSCSTRRQHKDAARTAGERVADERASGLGRCGVVLQLHETGGTDAHATLRPTR